MTSRLRLALFALVLLIVAAAVGIASGSRRSSPEEAKPVTPMLDVAGFRSVELLAPEQRKPWLDGSQFARPLAPDPRRGGSAKPAPAHAGRDAGEALPAVAGARQYRIRENDNMSKIARREYGDEKLAAWLLQVNHISDPTKLGIGDLIQLPPPPEPGEIAKRGALQPTPVASGKTYVVRKNETLGEISQKVYGTARHADLLMKANGLKRPEDLRTGQTLTIPAL